MVKPRKIAEGGPMRKYAAAINDLIDCVDALKIQRGLNYSVRQTQHGQVIQLENKQEKTTIKPGSRVQRFRVDQQYDDYLGCRKVTEDGIPDDADVNIYNVAKPLHLRKSTQTQVNYPFSQLGYPFSVLYPNQDGGAVRHLTAANAGQPNRYIKEIVWPLYANDDIYAAEAEEKTGVIVNGTRLTWIDLNVDGRQYRPTYTRIAVCVLENGQNVTKYMYVAGGPIQA